MLPARVPNMPLKASCMHTLHAKGSRRSKNLPIRLSSLVRSVVLYRPGSALAEPCSSFHVKKCGGTSFGLGWVCISMGSRSITPRICLLRKAQADPYDCSVRSRHKVPSHWTESRNTADRTERASERGCSDLGWVRSVPYLEKLKMRDDDDEDVLRSHAPFLSLRQPSAPAQSSPCCFCLERLLPFLMDSPLARTSPVHATSFVVTHTFLRVHILLSAHACIRTLCGQVPPVGEVSGLLVHL